MMSRFSLALRRYHPLIWFFAEPSLVSTRLSRFLITFEFVLTSIFVTTVFYDIYYPSDSACNSFSISASECLAATSKVFADESACVFDSTRGECSLRPPPTSVTYIISVAICTVLAIIPLNIIFNGVLTVLCSRRPRIEIFGLDPILWLGSIDSSQRKFQGEASDEEARLQAIVRLIYGSLNLYGERLKTNGGTSRENEGMSMVLEKLPLVMAEDGKVELSRPASFWYPNVHVCIRRHVTSALANARRIVSSMKKDSDVQLQDSFFIQHFVMERYNLIDRLSLYRLFALRAHEVPRTIHPVTWVLAWLFVVSFLLFFIVWILQWGTARAQDFIITSWGTNFLLSNVLEKLIFTVARIFFINVLPIERLRPQLKHMKTCLTLKAASKPISANESSVEEEGRHFLLQYLEPSLLAANFAGSDILKALSDADIYDIVKGKMVFDEEGLYFDENDEFQNERRSSLREPQSRLV